MRIRSACRDDLEIIIDFQVEMAVETEHLVLDRDLLCSGVLNVLDDQSRGSYYIAEDDRVVGCLMVTKEWSDWRDGEFWWIQSVYVSPEHRNRGVYSALHSHVRKDALEDPLCRGLRLYTKRDNSAARKVYEKRGMEDTGYVVYEDLF